MYVFSEVTVSVCATLSLTHTHSLTRHSFTVRESDFTCNWIWKPLLSTLYKSLSSNLSSSPLFFFFLIIICNIIKINKYIKKIDKSSATSATVSVLRILMLCVCGGSSDRDPVLLHHSGLPSDLSLSLSSTHCNHQWCSVSTLWWHFDHPFYQVNLWWHRGISLIHC